MIIEAIAETEPRAVRAWYAADSERVFMELTKGVIMGVIMGFPYQLLQGLENGTPKQLAEVEIMPTGSALHWESLPVDRVASTSRLICFA